MAVTGRQKRYLYLARITEICASAATTSIIAKNRAASATSSDLAVAISRPTRLYCRITLADQNRATAVWSADRAVLVASPIDLVSLKESTQVLLVSAGGGGGMSRSTLSRMNGLTFATHGVCGGANGGVSLHTPGPAGSGGNVDVVAIGVVTPAPLLSRINWFAATQPIRIPASFACPSGIAASDSARNASSFGAAAGK